MKSLLEQILTDRPAWMRSALCAQVDGDLFFPEKGESGHDAKRVCRGCPVRLPCLEYGLAAREPHGIYGGLSARERTRLLRSQQTRRAA